MPEPYASIRRRLMRWFHANQRDLPWRRTRNPYTIWVSEVMLQQTQVTAVIPFFNKFLTRFPTMQDLAAASEQEVLRYWEGLGYYRRARHLHQAAQEIMNKHAGQFPEIEEAALELPGLGRYTVGAILSQAYDQRLPVVDANVARILCRLFAWKEELEAKPTQDWLWQTAEQLLPRKEAGNFNQALMELGQTLCTTGQPSCLLCPLRDQCRAHATGQAATLPRRRGKAANTHVKECAVILRKGQRVLLCQRKADANRWASMWEFPTRPLLDAEESGQQAANHIYDVTGYLAHNFKTLGSLNYGITRYSVTLEVLEAHHHRGRPHTRTYQQLTWVKPSQLPDYPLSIPQRRLARSWLLGD